MTAAIENEVNASFDFDLEALVLSLLETALEIEECPYDASVELVITDDEGIHQVNRKTRGIDSPTDVLSFPNAFYESPADFEGLEQQDDVFDPDTGEYMLGSMMISADKVRKQAAEYGHSEKREFAFLVVHSILHLLGFDHMEDGEREEMEEEQRKILNTLGITR